MRLTEPSGTPDAAIDPADPVAVARALIRRPSVTPEDAGAIGLVAGWAERIGMRVERLRFGAVENLFAIVGEGRHLCFAGHTDVVPPGSGWRHDPFGGVIEGGVLHGRGACDMKGGVAAFIAAAARWRARGGRGIALSFLVTGDEEAEAVDGTARVLDWMAERKLIPDFCLVAEPSCPARLGEAIKIGRRGSVSAEITVRGTQGHTAYPDRAGNAAHRVVALLGSLIAARPDEGTEWFEPSRLQVTSVDVGNPTFNVIPGRATARVNIRFNDLHTGASLAEWMRAEASRHGAGEPVFQFGAEPFLTAPGADVAVLTDAVARVTGITPALTTTGGTSDARFIARHCKVAEFGPVNALIHKVDEAIPVAELEALTRIYESFIDGWANASRPTD